MTRTPRPSARSATETDGRGALGGTSPGRRDGRSHENRPAKVSACPSRLKKQHTERINFTMKWLRSATLFLRLGKEEKIVGAWHQKPWKQVFHWRHQPSICRASTTHVATLFHTAAGPARGRSASPLEVHSRTPTSQKSPAHSADRSAAISHRPAAMTGKPQTASRPRRAPIRLTVQPRTGRTRRRRRRRRRGPNADGVAQRTDCAVWCAAFGRGDAIRTRGDAHKSAARLG